MSKIVIPRVVLTICCPNSDDGVRFGLRSRVQAIVLGSGMRVVRWVGVEVGVTLGVGLQHLVYLWGHVLARMMVGIGTRIELWLGLVCRIRSAEVGIWSASGPEW